MCKPIERTSLLVRCIDQRETGCGDSLRSTPSPLPKEYAAAIITEMKEAPSSAATASTISSYVIQITRSLLPIIGRIPRTVSSIQALYSSRMARRCCWCASKAVRARRT
jgi:hypothetical protein